jgi:hypothetical protein
MLKTGAAWLDAQRTAHMSESVVYIRGNDSVTVTASIGKTIFRTENSFGFIEHYEGRDYFVLAADLLIDGSPVEPEAGDKVQETDGPVVRTYEVMAPGGEPCWRWSDEFNKTLRIHAKHVGTEVIS